MSLQTYFTLGLSEWKYKPSINKIVNFFKISKEKDIITNYCSPAGVFWDLINYMPELSEIYNLHNIESVEGIWGREKDFLNDLEITYIETTRTLGMADIDALVLGLNQMISLGEVPEKMQMSYFSLNWNSVEEIVKIIEKYDMALRFSGALCLAYGIHAGFYHYYEDNYLPSYPDKLAGIPIKESSYRRMFPNLNLVDESEIICYLGNFSLSLIFNGTFGYERLEEFFQEIDNSQTVQTLKNQIQEIILKDTSGVDIVSRMGRTLV